MNQTETIAHIVTLADGHGINHFIAGNQLLVKDTSYNQATKLTNIVWVNVSAWSVDKFIKWLGY